MYQELFSRGVVKRPQPVLTEEGCDAAALCQETMADFLHALLASGGLGLAATREAELVAYVLRRLDRPFLQQILAELPTQAWVQAESCADEAFAAAEKKRCLAGLQLSLLRAVLQAGGSAVSPQRAAAAAGAVARDVRSGQLGSWQVAMAAALQRAGCGHVLTATAEADGLGADADADAVDAGDSNGIGRSAVSGLSVASDEASAAGAAAAAGSAGELARNGEEAAGVDPSTLALSEPLTEPGYQSVVALRSTEAMAAFVRRVVLDEGGEVLSSAQLGRFAAWYSGELSAQSLGRLRLELATQDWVRFGAGGGGRLYLDCRYEGVTKVLSVREGRRAQVDEGDAAKWWQLGGGRVATAQAAVAELEWWSLDVQLAGFHACVVHQPLPHALGTRAELAGSGKEEELFAVTADHLRILKEPGKRRVEVSLHHFQVDNLREADRQWPIIFAPQDSGYHGGRREEGGHHAHRRATSFLHFAIEQVPSGILHLKELQLLMQPVIARLDLVFWMGVGSGLLEWVCTIPYHTIPCHTIVYYIILYYTILYYTILYYTILYYTILY